MNRWLVLLAACGNEAGPIEPPVETGVCDGVITEVERVASPHVETGAAAGWNSNPPTSGPHSPAWAGFDRNYAELPREYWVHDLEHGAIVLAYHCPAGCLDVVTALEDIVRATAVDPLCIAPLNHRLLVVADPLLPAGVQVAAVAWGFHYTATCVDESALRDFITEHYADAPENFCSDGLPFTGTRIE